MMNNDKRLRYMFVDMNSYFASVEQQENKNLRGKPVAVLPSMTQHTCAIAASAEAKQFGIKTGTMIRDALDLCPHLNCVPARHDVYVDYHNRILEESVKHTPITKVWSIDEFSSRLTPDNQSIAMAVDLSRRLKHGLAQNVGEHVKSSIGLAPNSYLAKVATDMQKPDGLVVLTHDLLQDALFPLHLTDFPGIGDNIQRRLNRGGIWTVEQLWNTQPKQLREIWGSIEGEKFWYRLHGHDIPDINHNKSMVGHSRVLDPAHRTPDIAKQIARRLVIKAAQRLRRYELEAGHFSLRVTTSDNEKWTHDIRIDPTRENLAFIQHFNHLWHMMTDQLKPFRLKKVSLVMHDLKKPEHVTGNLFSISTARQKQHALSTELSSSMDTLNQKYGADTLHFGACPEILSDYGETKIAFSRIPDQAEFWK